MSVLNDHVLTLDKGWKPISTSTVQAAFGRFFAGTVQALNTDDYTLHGVESWLELPATDDDYAIRTGRLTIRVPEVIVCLESGSIPTRRLMQLGRRNLMKRDRGTCQYCGARGKTMTIDHIHPRSKGGKSTWANCVMACEDCNLKKGNKSLEQVAREYGFKLRVRPEMRLAYPNDPQMWTTPYEPMWTPIFHLAPGKFRESWTKFLSDKAIQQHKMMVG